MYLESIEKDKGVKKKNTLYGAKISREEKNTLGSVPPSPLLGCVLHCMNYSPASELNCWSFFP